MRACASVLLRNSEFFSAKFRIFRAERADFSPKKLHRSCALHLSHIKMQAFNLENFAVMIAGVWSARAVFCCGFATFSMRNFAFLHDFSRETHQFFAKKWRVLHHACRRNEVSERWQHLCALFLKTARTRVGFVAKFRVFRREISHFSRRSRRFFAKKNRKRTDRCIFRPSKCNF